MLDERGRILFCNRLGCSSCETELQTNIIMARSVKLGPTRLISSPLAVVLCSVDPYQNCWHPNRAAIFNVKTEEREIGIS